MKERPSIAVEQRALGRRVAELRRGAGHTQSVLAERAGVTVRYVQALEAGQYNPTFTTLVALADALDVEPAELLRPPRSAKPASRGRPPGVIETRERRRVAPAAPSSRPTRRTTK